MENAKNTKPHWNLLVTKIVTIFIIMWICILLLSIRIGAKRVETNKNIYSHLTTIDDIDKSIENLEYIIKGDTTKLMVLFLQKEETIQELLKASQTLPMVMRLEVLDFVESVRVETKFFIRTISWYKDIYTKSLNNKDKNSIKNIIKEYTALEKEKLYITESDNLKREIKDKVDFLEDVYYKIDTTLLGQEAITKFNNLLEIYNLDYFSARTINTSYSEYLKDKITKEAKY